MTIPNGSSICWWETISHLQLRKMEKDQKAFLEEKKSISKRRQRIIDTLTTEKNSLQERLDAIHQGPHAKQEVKVSDHLAMPCHVIPCHQDQEPVIETLPRENIIFLFSHCLFASNNWINFFSRLALLQINRDWLLSHIIPSTVNRRLPGRPIRKSSSCCNEKKVLPNQSKNKKSVCGNWRDT